MIDYKIACGTYMLTGPYCSCSVIPFQSLVASFFFSFFFFFPDKGIYLQKGSVLRLIHFLQEATWIGSMKCTGATVPD